MFYPAYMKNVCGWNQQSCTTLTNKKRGLGI